MQETAPERPVPPATLSADRGQRISRRCRTGAPAAYRRQALRSDSHGSETFYTVENDLMKITFSNKGGRVASVELKDYKTYLKTPLILFSDSTSVFDLSFFIKQGYNNSQINTGNYYFDADRTTPIRRSRRAKPKNSSPCGSNVDSAAYVEYVYTIRKDSYMIGFDIRFVGMDNLLSADPERPEHQLAERGTAERERIRQRE